MFRYANSSCKNTFFSNPFLNYEFRDPVSIIDRLQKFFEWIGFEKVEGTSCRFFFRWNSCVVGVGSGSEMKKIRNLVWANHRCDRSRHYLPFKRY
uniref:Uncharacterized protein n=1 Tax=Caenorhabditis japonica TaxID=281687 RepID=A0A8R1IH40_CAEJA